MRGRGGSQPEKSPMSPSPWFVGLEEGELGGEQSEGEANLWASSQNKGRGFYFPKPEIPEALLLLFEDSRKNPPLSQTLPLLPTPLSLLLLGGSASVDGPREGLWRVPQQCPEDCLRKWLDPKLSIPTRERREMGNSVLDFSVTGYNRR